MRIHFFQKVKLWLNFLPCNIQNPEQTLGIRCTTPVKFDPCRFQNTSEAKKNSFHTNLERMSVELFETHGISLD